MNRLIGFELRKIFSRRLTWMSLMVLFLFSVLLGVSAYNNMYAFDGAANEGTGQRAVEIDKTVAQKYEGILTDEKVWQMMADFEPKMDLHGLNALYLYRNSMQSAVFARFSDINGKWNGLSVSDVFGGEELKIGYVNGWLSTSQNLVKVFLLLSLIIIIMIAPVFSGEYDGVDNIILTSRYGRTKCPAAKAAAGFIAAVMVTALCILTNIVLAYVLYGKEGLDCSILFAPIEFMEGYIPFNITCMTVLKYQILLAFTSSVSVTGITLMISALCRNQMITVVTSAAVHLLPVLLPVLETSPLHRLIVLLPVYHSQYISIMSVQQMDNGMLYAIWAVPFALILMGAGIFISCRVFAKHKVL